METQIDKVEEIEQRFIEQAASFCAATNLDVATARVLAELLQKNHQDSWYELVKIIIKKYRSD